MDQVVQLIGALMILVPFAAAQFGRMRVTSAIYLGLNFGGSAILTGVAFEAQDWGFFLRERLGARFRHRPVSRGSRSFRAKARVVRPRSRGTDDD
jgi:hypothetical protein